MHDRPDRSPPRQSIRFRLAGTALLPLALSASSAAQSPQWSASFSSAKYDWTHAVIGDGSGGAIACGTTNGALFAPNVWNEYRAWIARLDASGAVVWSEQIGRSGNVLGNSLATDSSGGFFAAGSTDSGISGPVTGDWNVWAARFDLSGSPVWVKTIFIDGYEGAPLICESGGGGLFLAGSTDSDVGGTWAGDIDVFTYRMDAAGDIVGVGHIGSTAGEGPLAIAPDDIGGAWLCGFTQGSLAGLHRGLVDGWLSRCAPDGSFLWTVQLGSDGWDLCTGVVRDGLGGVLVAGVTTGDLGGPAKSSVPFVARYDGAGSQLWLRRYDDLAYVGTLVTGGLSGDGRGGAFLPITSARSIVGPNQGAEDLAWIHIDRSGDVDWMAQLGTLGHDLPACIAEDGRGGFFSGGATSISSPAHDAFVVHFDGWGVGFETYCTASASSIAGCTASIDGSGPVSLFDPQLFEIRSGAIPGGNLGLCIFGASGATNVPFGTQGGALCVQTPFFRSAPAVSGGTSGQCNGELRFGLDDLIAASTIVVAGADLRAQIWARDPASADGCMLSDALHFSVSP